MDALTKTNELRDLGGTSRPVANWPLPEPTGIDAYAPAEIAARVEKAGIGKARLPVLSLVVLAVLAGAFIAFGAMLSTLVMTGSSLSFGPGRLIGGIAFSLGLILVIVGGAELFTGNALIVMAAASRQVSTMALLRNWGLFTSAILRARSARLRWSIFPASSLSTLALWARPRARLRVLSSPSPPIRRSFAASCAMRLSALPCGCAFPRATWRARFWRLYGRYRLLSRLVSSIRSRTFI